MPMLYENNIEKTWPERYISVLMLFLQLIQLICWFSITLEDVLTDWR